MTTCPSLNYLWILSLGRLELDDLGMRLAFQLLDGRRFDG